MMNDRLKEVARHCNLAHVRFYRATSSCADVERMMTEARRAISAYQVFLDEAKGLAADSWEDASGED